MFSWLKSFFKIEKKVTPAQPSDITKTFPWPVKTLPAPQNAELPVFEYYGDTLGNKSIIEETGLCECCDMVRDYIYVGPIYTRYGSPKICPWCIDNGRAAEMWDASFQSLTAIDANSDRVILPQSIYKKITQRTPGYSTWQGNDWLFSDTDAMVFLGEAVGKNLIKEDNKRKISTVLSTLNEVGDKWVLKDLEKLTHGGQPSVYIFHDRDSDSYHAYQDFT